MSVSHWYIIPTLGLTPRKENVWEGDQFKNRSVEILQIQMRFASAFRFTGGEELTQEVSGRYGSSATNLTHVVQFVSGDKLHV